MSEKIEKQKNTIEKMNKALKIYQEKVKSGEIKKVKRSKIPSYKKSILEKCKDCCRDYVDGRLDCGVESCSLYFWMPYGKLKRQRQEAKNQNISETGGKI